MNQQNWNTFLFEIVSPNEKEAKKFKLMDSAAHQNAFHANIVCRHTNRSNQRNNFVSLNGLYTYIRCIYLFIIIFITAEFQIILKHSEKKEKQ